MVMKKLYLCMVVSPIKVRTDILGVFATHNNCYGRTKDSLFQIIIQRKKRKYGRRSIVIIRR